MSIQSLFRKYCKVVRFFDLEPLPLLIMWEPTLTCNFRCKFCGFYGPGGALPDIKKEMSFSQIEKMLCSIKEECTITPHIHITGGDPFMRKDFKKILYTLYNYKFTYSITTNGFLLNQEMVDVLKETGCRSITVSIHGPKELHDKIVGVPGAFERVTQNIRLLRKADLPVTINCVITDDNIDCLTRMRGVAWMLDCEIKFQHLEFLDKEHCDLHNLFSCLTFNKHLPVKYGTTTLSKKNITNLKMFVMQHKGLYEPELDYKEIDSYYKELRKYTHSPYCHSVFGTLRIDPYGNGYPCIDYYFGNFKKQSFSQVWKSEQARKFRKLIRKQKLMPGCVRCCKL